MGQVGTEVVLSNIIETLSIDRLVPVGLNRHAVKDGHECSHGDPNSTADHEDDDWHAYRGELKDTPVKGEYGDFAEKNGPRIEYLANEEDLVRLFEDVIDLGVW